MKDAKPAEHAARIGPDELASLLGAVQEAASRLEAGHAALREQVERLTRDLGDANAQLERSRRLAALGEMAAGIAHEVRNPLGCVQLYASMLEQDLRDRPRQAAIATKIMSAAKAVEVIVADVLTFAKEFKLRLEPLSVSEQFDRALELCCHDGVAGWRGVTIERADRDARCRPLTFEADGPLLNRALVNIIRNAFEAMAEAPGRPHRLRLDARERAVADGSGRLVRCAVLTVSDTGPGVTPEIVARMFNPFFTTRGAGTGLGLAIVHRIADAHGGRVSVSNNADGPGASVELVIPLSHADGGPGSMSISTRRVGGDAGARTEQAA